MPKIVDYPRAPLNRALALAEAVDKLGGEATAESAADHMGNKMGGAFKALMSGAIKFGFLSVTKGRLKVEPLYQDFKLAYSEEDKQVALRKAFMNAPLFAAVAKRLDGQPVPAHFEKLLIREYGVPEDVASRVVGYFVEAARTTGVMGPNGNINVGSISPNNPPPPPLEEEEEEELPPPPPPVVAKENAFTVVIAGFGMNTTIDIDFEEDLEILEATVKKMRRLLQKKEGTDLL